MTKKLKEAWDRTFKKWEPQLDKFDKNKASKWRSCGLCVLFYQESNCRNCPVKTMSGYSSCTNTPFYYVIKGKLKPEVEYLFLLFVYEATKDDK